MDSLDKLDARLAEIDAEEEQLRARLGQLETQRYGLRLARATLTGDPEPDAPGALKPAVRPRSRLGRSETVERLLRESPEPLDRHELARMLEDEGLAAHVDDVSASLTYLRSQKRVESAGGGRWRALD